ncbi:CoB--CoM heterodisulfide reductase subunit A [Desulfocucumis palustris]|uniref:CoB--CoM heterodisulfide reductase subunit A n=1 Tax=Desulfocucumis palustris TaxID=1898651 RepID=A0A2L2XFM8_9FIRM|nr:FAD-dependent oxidoreductase [Desulfocucumis palustris]GBF34503.1 CoB--CoM heterodisulfide reductase subunit A [Desulfocucumis palustris]
MAGNIGIFVCGCDGLISGVVDMAGVEAGLAKVKKRIGAKVFHPRLCGSGGTGAVRSAISQNALDCVIIAGCPESECRDVFNSVAAEAGLAPEMVLRLDIREGCAFPHGNNPGGATAKAVNLIKMWNARARLAEPYKPVYATGNRDVLVIGGGLAGLSSANELAEAGLNVTLIEKESYLGGRAGQFDKVFPRMCDSRCGVTFLVNRLKDNPGIKIMPFTEISGLKGSAGRFEAGLSSRPRTVDPEKCNLCGKCEQICPVILPDEYNFGVVTRKAVTPPRPLDQVGSYVINRENCLPGCSLCADICPAGAIALEREPASSTVKFGSIVLATGWQPFEAEKISRLGFGRYANVLTNVQMERIMSPDGPAGGRLVCPESGREPENVVFIQCAGSRDINYQGWCSTICCAATLKQAINIKLLNSRIKVYVFYIDIRVYGDYEELYSRAQEAGVVFVRSSPAQVYAEPGAAGLMVVGEDTLMGRTLKISADLVVLAAGMKPCGIPQPILNHLSHGQAGESRGNPEEAGLLDRRGFFVGHRQCFPLESPAQGIYPAGTCQEPMDMANTVRGALAAACKIFKTSGERVEVSPMVPQVDKAGCDKCKRCMEECPYGVWYFDNDGYPAPDPLYCKTCLTCVGACPRQCISAQGFSVQELVGTVTARVKETEPGEPHVVAFVCENDAYQAVLLAGRMGLEYPSGVHVIPVRCAGSCNMVLIQDGLPEGIDGFILAGCRHGECHYIHGADRTEERVANIKLTLRDIMIEPERVDFVRLGVRDAEKFAGHARDFVERLKKMGPSPFKKIN